MEATETKNAVSRSLKGACSMFLQDLQALPEEAYSQSFGPVCRTVADIVYEVILVNDHIGMVLRGEEPFEWPDKGWIKAPEEFRGKDVVIDAWEKSCEKIVATAEAFSDAELEETVETEQGPRTRTERFRFIGLHTWYHMGQLNFIQTLRGDDAWHWK